MHSVERTARSLTRCQENMYLRVWWENKVKGKAKRSGQIIYALVFIEVL